MNIYILDTTFREVDILDEFVSVIWTEKYRGYGDFEIYIPLNFKSYMTLREDYYLTLQGSKKSMIIETLDISTDKEKGNMLVVKGRSLESLLDRRIVWGQKALFGNLQEGINNLLCDAIIEPTEPTRTIPNFVFEISNDPNVTILTVDDQVTAENLYTVILQLCEINDLGFEISLKKPSGFTFRLYSGVDRTYDQILTPWVVFSNEFDNLLTSKQTLDKRYLKTVSLVLGAGEGADRAGAVSQIPSGAGEGMDRREMYTDGSDIAEEVEGIIVPPEEYVAQLITKGNKSLAENTQIEIFDGQVDTNGIFVYDRDFQLGDIVQIENNFGDMGKARITEVIRTWSATGEEVYPTFSMIG